MSISVGVAPGTWGISAADAPGQPSWQVFLDEAAEAGYAGIEAGPYGYLPTEPAILRSELESRGLRIIATTVMHGHLDDPEDWPVIEAEALRVGELGAAIGSHRRLLHRRAVRFSPNPPKDVLGDSRYLGHQRGRCSRPAFVAGLPGRGCGGRVCRY